MSLLTICIISKPAAEPASVVTQDEPVESKDYPRPPPPPAFAAEHGLPIETKNERKGAYAPFPRGDMSTSPKASFVHLHKSEVGRR